VFLDEGIVAQEIEFATIVTSMLLVVGPVEEFCKFAAVRWLAYKSRYFDEPIDGLVYAGAASLGFASLENVIYVLEFGPDVMLLRAPISTLGHLVFGSIWGYGLGLHVQSGYNRTFLVAGSILAASVVHAAFNIALFSVPMISLLIVGIGGFWVFGRFKWGQRVSPFRYKRNYPLIQCQHCTNPIRVTSTYCRFCGSAVLSEGAPLTCGNCSQPNRWEASYCIRCGDHLLKNT